MKIYTIGLALILLLLNQSGIAKWASTEEAPVKISINQDLTINASGLSKEIREVQFEIMKDPGREIAANYTLQYVGNCEKIKILEAKTIYKNKEYKLDKTSIEDKPLASSPTGFDQRRQILLAFPKAEVGAKIYLKYTITTTAIPLENFYASLFMFGNNDFISSAKVKLHSKIPLHILVNDPEKFLAIKQDTKDNFHNLEINLLRPIYKNVANEPDMNVVDNKYLTWVSISSATRWEDLGLELGAVYAKILKQKLPQSFAQIANIAKKQKTEIDQINTVTSLLNDKIQYMGDMRTINGRIIPRDLNKIAKTQLGDCKDFSAATAAILNQLGFKAQIAIVRRGIRSFYPKTLPDLAAFNHAFVKATNQQGKVYWIDPTNFQSMADGIFPDIATKMTIVTDEKNSTYEQVPNIQQDHAQSTSTRQIEVLNNNKILETGKITLTNENAQPLTGLMLQTSVANIKDFLFNGLSHTILEDKNKKSLSLPELKSRIVKEIIFTYSFEQDDRIFKTNLGQAINLYHGILDGLFSISQNSVSDAFIDIYPSTHHTQTIIKNAYAQDAKSLNLNIKTPWLAITRTCYMNKNNELQIDDTIITYKNLIPNEELKNPQFIALKENLEKNYKDVAIILTQKK